MFWNFGFWDFALRVLGLDFEIKSFSLKILSL